MSQRVSRIIETNLMSDVGMTHLQTFEYAKVTRIAKEVAIELGYRNIIIWKLGEGFFDTRKNETIGTLADFRAKELEFDYKTIIIFQDIHRLYEDTELLLSFQELLEKIAVGELAINTVGISPEINIPQEIERYSQVETISLPSQQEIATLVNSQFLEYGYFIGRSMVNKIAESLLGLIEDEIPPLINKILVVSQNKDILINEDILFIAQEQKKQIIKKSGILEFVTPSVSMEDVGGLYTLKSWLRTKKEIFEDRDAALEYGIKPPKGILLFGMPGSGKSLVAKVTANYFKLPLLRVDMGLIFGQKSPEEAIGRMIAMADAISPCVLWIDEIEKALSGAESGATDNVSMVILGVLLTWMQERTKPVFIIATANDVSKIRPELYRDGRIDEKFMLGFLGSDVGQVEQIIEIHLRIRLKDKYESVVRKLDYNAIVRKMNQMVIKVGGESESAGYAGANMEALVEKVLQDKFSRGSDYVDTKDFVRLLNDVLPQNGIEIKRMLKRAEEMEARVA